MTRRRTLFHGGTSGLAVGDTIKPNRAYHKHVDGCPTCEAKARGDATLIDAPTPPDWVYATRDKAYARFYASMCRGDLYQVRLIGDVERSNEDQFPSWRGRRARIESVAERGVTLSWSQRRQLFKRWGGTDTEFDAMVTQMGLTA